MSHRAKVLLTVVLTLVGIAYGVHRVAGSREWQQFRSEDFWASFLGLRLSYVLLAAALIFASYLLRCLRWREFLRPMTDASLLHLLVATLVGFSAVALLGRPGEVVRPWLIARKEGLAVSSQLAAWVIERVLDSLTIAGILGLALLVLPSSTPFLTRQEPILSHFRRAGILLFAGAVAFGILLSEFRKRQPLILEITHSISRPLPARYRAGLGRIAESFCAGLTTVGQLRNLAVCSALSLLVWLTVVAAYWSVAQALGEPMSDLGLPAVVLVTAATVVGSLAHLPGVGGGSQVAAALALTQLFGIPLAVATSAALLLWALSFMMVLVPGLPLAAREGLSWQQLRGVALNPESRIRNPK